MQKLIFLITLLLKATCSFAQTAQLEFNKEYENIKVEQARPLVYNLKFEKGKLYAVSVMQQGIDVKLLLIDANNKQILDKDSPNGSEGLEKFEYLSPDTKTYTLKIERFDENANAAGGKVNIFVKKFSKSDIALKEKNRKEVEPENKKTVQTLDIDHFWEAFDHLKNCNTRKDSILTFQTMYLDKATDGLIDFIDARQFTAEKFVNSVARLPKFFNSIRKNTLEVKRALPIVEEIVSKFQQVYPNFKPFKVCFAIGLVNTGGTVSGKFLLIGSEITTSTKNTDLSEFNNSAFSKQLANGEDIIQKIKNMVAHEYVHTQQTTPYDKNAIGCGLLYSVMSEGFCDFIGELTSGSQINLVAREYGDKHEKELWQQLKNELCNNSAKNWIYNYSTVKDKPGDLGYYMGYKIAEEYYKNATDKKQAVTDIIEMNDPIKFLQLSKYDQKQKK